MKNLVACILTLLGMALACTKTPEAANQKYVMCTRVANAASGTPDICDPYSSKEACEFRAAKLNAPGISSARCMISPDCSANPCGKMP